MPRPGPLGKPAADGTGTAWPKSPCRRPKPGTGLETKGSSTPPSSARCTAGATAGQGSTQGPCFSSTSVCGAPDTVENTDNWDGEHGHRMWH